ncbi:MAG TPA: phenylalanine--tRNA ligase subunit beta, partial [Capsulimonadaceae bacterium]|nr:phenylalanine--tRNA ligase subunit beta [Capsulimonadaceae bacterium]
LPLTPGDTGQFASVEIEAPKLCPRYCAKIVQNVRHAASPDYIQRRLVACGMRPINAVVDITNYVMLELGQPLHAFDYDQIPDGKIIVRTARAGEKLTTLDGVERTLDPEVLVIADSSHAIALAGIMGGGPTEVSESTKNILIESAHFNPQVVRRAAKALGISTEASYRFERHVDPTNTPLALEMAADLIAQHAGGEPVSGRIDVNPIPENLRALELRPERARQILGLSLSDDKIEDAIKRLGIARMKRPSEKAGAALLFAIPSSRSDIVREIDLIEEIGRIVGYDSLPETLPPARGMGGGDNETALFNNRLRQILVGEGLTEAYNHALSAPSPFDDPTMAARRANIRMALSAELSGLRLSLLPSLLQNLALNLRHRETDVRLFEVGKVYLALGKGDYVEPYRAGGVMAGEGIDYFHAKGVVQSLFAALSLSGAEFAPVQRHGMHPGRTAEVKIGGSPVGFVAEIDPDAVREHLDVPASADRIACFELDADLLRTLAQEAAKRQYQPPPRFPSIMRDLAMLYDRATLYGEIEKTIKASAGDLLESVSLVSVYTGERVAVNRKSVAVRLVLRAGDRTLTDADADGVLAAVQGALSKSLGAEAR